MAEEAGFVGLGVMGGAMAANLARGYRVAGFDVDASRFRGLAGVTQAKSLEELARRSTVICLSLPDAKVVEQVTLGDGGLVHCLAEGSLVIDLSTSMPAVSRRIAARLAEKRVQFADAPVSGGEAGAKAATLAIMVGADAATFERCKPILSAMGKTVVRVGDPGAGNVAKLVNNMIVASAFAVIAEGFALAAENKVDLQLLYEAIREGWAGSKVLDTSVPAMVARDYTPGGTVNMMEKDLGYARSLAAESRVPIPMTAAAHEVFVAGQAAGKGPQSQPVIIELWRERGTNVTIALGADDAAYELKELIKRHLEELHVEVTDYGVFDTRPSLYPDIAFAVAVAISEGKHERGILMCGTGLGMAITANKVPGVRAATCHDTYSAERARKSNNAQILTMGARVIGPELAKTVVDAWLKSEFQGGGSTAKVERISEYEKRFLKK